MTLRQSFRRCLPLEFAVFVGLLVAFDIALFEILTSPKNVLAQSNIVPDNTLGAESSVVITNYQGLPSGASAITGGAVRGINLFHSFREFNVSAGRGAYFLSPDASIQNILARVTGSNSSSILGRLGTFGSSQPNLFLINPNGIIFGANASLDVGGSFVATTANAVQLGETGFFSATQPQSSSLLTVNPSALLYNAIVNQSQITNGSRATRLGTVINGSPNRQFSGLQVLDGKSLLLVGGDIRFERLGTLQAPGGRVELGGLTSPGIVGLNVDGNILSLNFPDTIQRADVFFGTFARVNVASTGGGDIAIDARNIDVSEFTSLRAGITSRSRTTDSQAGDITLNATEQIKVEQGSQILNSVNPLATGNSGNIRIKTGSLILSNNSELITSAYGEGNAGSMTIDARDRIVIDGGSVMSDASQILDNKGKAGDIRITTGSLLVKNEAKLSTSTNGQGDTGSIIVDARDSVSFDRSNALSEIGQGGIGKGGDIRINTRFLSVTNGAKLSTSTSGQGDAGSVIINVSVREAQAVPSLSHCIRRRSLLL
ncbi:filamentous hemagglutinin N-terminal domain-containing protein [Scytonema sp. UIC 10036]|uniref:filamentous hemagglutinin N-terminal domain-containing protein n=1 Tax=Scytonema sp. UIC 10036 TaxID=2304196 RepID=UPI0012DA8DF3|nr:filamentous hemagglutinin N-terminal domain-containing protein [Scytonema sp. UIC 10036]MUG96608.1 filamentous hemagglutinin N-terminal domain-containing protein [Scytonema sp. UIC 10036]